MALTFALQKNVAQKVPWTFALYQVSTPLLFCVGKKGGKKLGQNLIRKRKLADQKSVALTVEICWRRCF